MDGLLPTAEEVLKQIIEGLRLHKSGTRAQKPERLSLRLKRVAGFSEDTCRGLCAKYGFAPDELWRPGL